LQDLKPAADDLSLIETAARAAGTFVLDRMKRPYKTVQKPGVPTPWGKTDSSPVTDVDLETDALLTRDLRAARPDYGWLSEETADDPHRLACARAFIVDPIDGTSAFLRGKPEFTIVVAVVDHGQPAAAAVYNPSTEEMFTAARGRGAHLNGQRLAVSQRAALEGARMLGTATFFGHPAWPRKWPVMTVENKASLAYRLALVAAGRFDGMLALNPKHEWDIAAGSLLVTEAGGLATNHDLSPWTFNKPDPQELSMIAAGPLLHGLIRDHIKDIQIPGTASTNGSQA
jgi:myo-inositol-1(or 4)-monophosphatase